MEVGIAVAKVSKYATSKSGDTVEVVERPNGGLSVVMADGQSSGHGAKWISTLVVRKVITLLAEGVRDGAAARAASDSLYTERGGRVSSTLNILSVDKHTNTLVVTRNNPVPLLLVIDSEIRVMDEPSRPVGLYRDTRPVICQVDLKPGLVAVVYSDGLIHAGDRTGQHMDVAACLKDFLSSPGAPTGESGLPINITPQAIADSLLDTAISLDSGRPVDDITVVVLLVTSLKGDSVRRLSVRLPLDS